METITLPRGLVEAWADDALAISAGLRQLRSELRGEQLLPDQRERLADADRLAADLVRDLAGHGVMPSRSTAAPTLLIVPGNAAQVRFLDEIDPVPGGRFVSEQEFRALATVSAGDGDADSDEAGAWIALCAGLHKKNADGNAKTLPQAGTDCRKHRAAIERHGRPDGSGAGRRAAGNASPGRSFAPVANSGVRGEALKVLPELPA